MKAIFHIGRPKVGSTTLQVFLADNREALAEQGVLYDRLVERISSQWEFPIAALAECDTMPTEPYVKRVLNLSDIEDAKAYGADMMRSFEERLARADDNLHTWVGSSEHVYPFMTEPSQVQAFDTLLNRHFDGVTYVVYLRRQEDLILSAYSEAVRRGIKNSFEDFVDGFIKNGRGNYMATLWQWLGVVGRDRLVVRLLEPDALVGSDLIDDFCDVIGISSEGMHRPRLHNASLTKQSLRAFLLINRGVASVNTSDETLQSLRDALCSTAEAWGSGGEPMTLPPGLYQRIRKNFSKSNEKLRARFFPERDELFPAKPARPAPGM